ncbi:MAG: endonuclease/exonuclease/phosphatase family protein [Actinomycetes bacterium]
MKRVRLGGAMVAALCPVLACAVVGLPTAAATTASVQPALSTRALPYFGHNVKAAAVAATTVRLTFKRSAKAAKYSVQFTRDKGFRYEVFKRNCKRSPCTITVPAAQAGVTYWYRVFAKNRAGRTIAQSPLRTLFPRVGQPTGLIAQSGQGTGIVLRWNPAVNAQSYQITQAHDPGFTQGVVSFTSASPAGMFTPTQLGRGQQYYFRVKAANGGSSSGFSNTAGAVMMSALAAVSVGTFNIRGPDAQLPWTGARRDGLAEHIKASNFDVIGLQEAAVSTSFGSLYPLLSGEYGLFSGRTDQILYRRSVFTPQTSTAGVVWLGSTPEGAPNDVTYVLLRHNATGAKVLYVTTHLASGPPSLDGLRAAETSRLIATVAAVNTGNWPVVYCGDFNSSASPERPSDSPFLTFMANGISDARFASPIRTNDQYNSANKLDPVPIAHPLGYQIDRIFVSGSVGVRDWELLMRVSGGRYVTPFISDHNAVRATVLLPY